LQDAGVTALAAASCREQLVATTKASSHEAARDLQQLEQGATASGTVGPSLRDLPYPGRAQALFLGEGTAAADPRGLVSADSMEAAATELASTLSSSTLRGIPYAAAAAASPLVQQQLRRLHELHQQLQLLRPFPH